MNPIVTGVYPVGGSIKSFVVDGDEGVVLVDTGLPNKDGLIDEGLRSIGRSLEDLVAIVITHSHTDHIGGAAALKEAANPTVIASVGDTPAIQGETRIPGPPILRGPLSLLTKLLPTPDPVAVDLRVDEKNQMGMPEDFRVIDTPGHSPGHTSYLLNRVGGVMFVGDAAVQKDDTITPGFFNAGGGPAIKASIGHIAEYEFEVAVFGHALPITTGAAGAFRGF